MSKVDWVRATAVGLIFGLVWQLIPNFNKGFLLGFTLLLVVTKIEKDSTNE